MDQTDTDALASWHVVVGQGGVVLGVYGSALLSEAQRCAKGAERMTGFGARVEQAQGMRPRVGDAWKGLRL